MPPRVQPVREDRQELCRHGPPGVHPTLSENDVRWVFRRSLVNHALRHEWLNENPAKHIRRFREQSRNRFLDGDELRRFLHALADEPNRTLRDLMLVLLLTGARRSNVQAMRWDDLDLNRGLWIVPADKSKSGEQVAVVLAPQVVELIKPRRESVNGSPFVFPSKSKNGHVTEPKSAWRRACERAGLADVRLHDLRRTLGSWQAAGGSSLPIIGRSLGHKSQQATAVYARLRELAARSRRHSSPLR